MCWACVCLRGFKGRFNLGSSGQMYKCIWRSLWDSSCPLRYPGCCLSLSTGQRECFSASQYLTTVIEAVPLLVQCVLHLQPQCDVSVMLTQYMEMVMVWLSWVVGQYCSVKHCNKVFSLAGWGCPLWGNILLLASQCLCLPLMRRCQCVDTKGSRLLQTLYRKTHTADSSNRVFGCLNNRCDKHGALRQVSSLHKQIICIKEHLVLKGKRGKNMKVRISSTCVFCNKCSSDSPWYWAVSLCHVGFSS